MTSEKRLQKYTDDLSPPRSGWCFLIGGVPREVCFNQSEALPKTDTSSVWNFFAHFSDVISRKPMVASRNVGFFSQATNVFISHARLPFSNGNRPFYRYGGHIEFITFKEYYGIPSMHEHDPIFSLSIYARFSNQFFFKFSWKRIVMGKKDCCAVFGCNIK